MAPKKPKKPKKKLSDYNRFIARELKGKTGPGYKGRFKAAVTKWKRSNKSGSKPRARAKPSSNPKPRARANPKPKGGKSTMGNSGFNTQKIFKYLRIGALVLPAAETALSPGTVPQKISKLKSDYFGLDTNNNFSLQRAQKGWMPFLFATVVTYGVPKIAGLIRSFK